MVLLLLGVYLFFSGVYCGMFSPGLLEAGGRCSEGFWEVQAGMGVIPKVWNFAKIVPSCCKQPPLQCFGAQGRGWNGWNHQCTASCCCFCCCFFFVGVCFCRLLQPRQDFSQAQKGLRALPVLLRFISVGMRPRISKADKILLETFFWGGEVHAKKGGQVDAVLVIFGNKNAFLQFWRLVRIFVVGRWYWRYLSSRFQVGRFDCFSLPWILPTFLFEGLPKIGQGGSGHRFHLAGRKWESDVTDANKMLREAEQQLTSLGKERTHLQKTLRGAKASCFAEGKVNTSGPRTTQRNILLFWGVDRMATKFWSCFGFHFGPGVVSEGMDLMVAARHGNGERHEAISRKVTRKAISVSRCQFQAYMYHIHIACSLLPFSFYLWHSSSCRERQMLQILTHLSVPGWLHSWMMRQGIANREEDKTALESPYQKINSILQKIDRTKKDALCGLWEEERRYDVDDQQNNLTWPEYLEKKLGVLLRVVSWWWLERSNAHWRVERCGD